MSYAQEYGRGQADMKGRGFKACEIGAEEGGIEP